MIDSLNSIDEILAGFEDFLHGIDGKRCSYARKLIREMSVEIQIKAVNTTPYQLCPKCNGQGQVSKPPYIAGDVHAWSSTSLMFVCDVCNGKKIIPMFHC